MCRRHSSRHIFFTVFGLGPNSKISSFSQVPLQLSYLLRNSIPHRLSHAHIKYYLNQYLSVWEHVHANPSNRTQIRRQRTQIGKVNIRFVSQSFIFLMLPFSLIDCTHSALTHSALSPSLDVNDFYFYCSLFLFA